MSHPRLPRAQQRPFPTAVKGFASVSTQAQRAGPRPRPLTTRKCCGGRWVTAAAQLDPQVKSGRVSLERPRSQATSTGDPQDMESLCTHLSSRGHRPRSCRPTGCPGCGLGCLVSFLLRHFQTTDGGGEGPQSPGRFCTPSRSPGAWSTGQSWDLECCPIGQCHLMSQGEESTMYSGVQSRKQGQGGPGLC